MERNACYGLIDHANKKSDRTLQNPNTVRRRELREQAWRAVIDEKTAEIDGDEPSRRARDEEA